MRRKKKSNPINESLTLGGGLNHPISVGRTIFVDRAPTFEFFNVLKNNKLGLSCAKLRLTFAKIFLALTGWVVGNCDYIAGTALGNF